MVLAPCRGDLLVLSVMSSGMEPTSAHRTVVGAGWMVLWRVTTRVLGVVSTLILARVLIPADFGIVAIATTYVAAFDALSEVGLQDAVIRSDIGDRSLFDTAFTIGAVRGLINGLLVAVSTPFAARFFSEPRLTPVLFVLAILAVLQGLENFGTVEFRRDLRFEKEFLIFLVPRLVSVLTTITATFILRSYWAMVIGIAVLRIVRLAFTYGIHAYRPRLRIGAWRQLFAFSFWTWAAGLAVFCRDRSWAIILGRLFAPFAVGVFMMASEIALLPVSEVVYPICRALFPGFTAARKEGSRLGDLFARTVEAVALPILPAAIGISAIAGDIVHLALGPKWLAAIPVMQWIAATAPLTVLSSIGATTMIASGQVRNNFLVIAIGAVFGTLSCLFAASHFGLTGAAVSVAIFAGLEGLAFGVVTAHSVGIGVLTWASRIGRPVMATCVMALLLWLTGYGWGPVSQPYDRVAVHGMVAVFIGAVSYGATLSLLWIIAGRPTGAEEFLLGFLRNRLAVVRRAVKTG